MCPYTTFDYSSIFFVIISIISIHIIILIFKNLIITPIVFNQVFFTIKSLPSLDYKTS